MRWNEVFVYPRVAELVAAETLAGWDNTPNPNLGTEDLVELCDKVRIFDYHFQGDHITSRVYALVCSRASNEG